MVIIYGMINMSRFLEIVYDFFRGMSSFIAPEKLPKTILEVIENYELMLQLGNLKKRRGYENILTTGLTTLKAMIEFVNSNDDRLLVVQDGTGIKESIYSAFYGGITAITNDERTAGSTVDQAYPLVHNNEIRSPAGIGSDNYRPFWYGYIEAATRFNGEASIAAGKYLTEKFPNTFFTDGDDGDLELAFTVHNQSGGSHLSGGGVDAGYYNIFVSPVIDGYQRCFPQFAARMSIKQSDDGIARGYLKVNSTYNENRKRVTAFDIFIARSDTDYSDDDSDIISDFKEALNDDAYFYRRINLDEDGKPFLTISGTLEAANPPTYVEFDDDFADWETFELQNCLCDFTASTDYTRKIVGARTENGTKVQYGLADLVNADNGLSVTLKIYQGWYNAGGYELLKINYDNYYFKLGSEMYTYLNIPQGDLGLDDYKHKYGLIVNGRYVGFGFDDDNGYYSPPNAFDVLCALNIIRLTKKVVGCAKAGRDAYAFYKTGGSRVSIYGNANIDQDDSFLDVGLTNQKAVAQLDDDSFAFMSYSGPCLIRGRQKDFIGEDIKTWFERTGDLPLFTNAQKEACVAGYNHLKEHIYFSFPTYTTSPYTNGIVFVFDLRAWRRKFEPWKILKTDTPLYNFTLSEDVHCLAGGLTKIVDFNGSTQDETVSTRLVFNLLKSTRKRVKTLFHRLYLDVDTDDTVTINAYYDGSSSASALTTINADGETKIGQSKQSMKLEITTPASTNDVEISSMKIKALPGKH